MKKLLFDFFPVVLFFLVFKLYPGWVPAEQSLCLGLCIPGGSKGAIYAATLMAILASILQVAWLGVRKQKIETMHWLTLGLLVVLGGATVFLQDEVFIKWKPTAVNWLFGIVFLGSHFVAGGKPIIQRMLEKNVTLSAAHVWVRLSLLWVAFFFSVGVINLYVAFNYPTDTWVNFKMFGMLGLTIVFIILQSMYLARYIVETETSED